MPYLPAIRFCSHPILLCSIAQWCCSCRPSLLPCVSAILAFRNSWGLKRSSPDDLAMDSTPAAVNATMRALAALYGKAHVNRALDDVNLVRVPSDDYQKISQAGDSAATAYGEITPAGVIDILK